MALSEDKQKTTKQITMFVPNDVLDKVDAAARETYNKNNARTTWIIEAMKEKLDRDAELTEGVSDEASASRVKEIVSAYASMNETGKEWLHLTACVARGADDFKQ